MERKWFIVYNGQQTGPLTKYELINYGLTPDSSVWCEGMSDWVKASDVPELGDALGLASTTAAPMTPPSAKSKIVAGLLAIFLGSLGIQYFYLGKSTAGIVSIVLSLVTCGLWEIVTFIQGVLMLIMSDSEFNRKYVYTQAQFPVF